MVKSKIPQRGNDVKKAKKDSSKSKFVTRVVQYKTLAKMYMRGYATPGGSMLFNDGERAVQHFTLEKILDDYDAEDNNGNKKFESELLKRPNMGLSMSCGTIASACDARNHLPSLSDITGSDSHECSQTSRNTSSAEICKAYEKTGLPAALQHWKSPSGLVLMQAIQYLDTSNLRDRSIAEIKKHLRVVSKWYGNKSDAAARMKEYAKQADFSSRSYGGAIHEMEMTVLFSNPRKWAKRIPEVKKQNQHIQKWIKNSDDEKLFINALAESLLTKANKGSEQRKQTQRGLPGSQSSEEEGHEGESEDGNPQKQSRSSGSDENKGDAEDNSSSDAASKQVSSANNSSTDNESPSAKRSKVKTLSKTRDSRKLSWKEWRRLGMTEGKNIEKQIRALSQNNLKLLSRGIEDSEGLQFPQAAIASARRTLKLNAGSHAGVGTEVTRCSLLKELSEGEEKIQEDIQCDLSEVYVAWGMCAAQQASSEINIFSTNYATKECTLQRLKDAINMIPGKLLQSQGLEELPAKLDDFKRLPRWDTIKAIIEKLQAITTQADTFFDGQCGVGASSSMTEGVRIANEQSVTEKST